MMKSVAPMRQNQKMREMSTGAKSAWLDTVHGNARKNHARNYRIRSLWTSVAMLSYTDSKPENIAIGD